MASSNGGVDPGRDVGGPTMFARIGVMRALNRGYVREFDTSRKETHWGKAEAEERRMTCYSANNPIALGIHLIGHHDLRDARRTQSTKSNQRTQSKNRLQRGRAVLARR